MSNPLVLPENFIHPGNGIQMGWACIRRGRRQPGRGTICRLGCSIQLVVRPCNSATGPASLLKGYGIAWIGGSIPVFCRISLLGRMMAWRQFSRSVSLGASESSR